MRRECKSSKSGPRSGSACPRYGNRCQTNAANFSVDEACDVDVQLEIKVVVLKSLVAELRERG